MTQICQKVKSIIISSPHLTDGQDHGLPLGPVDEFDLDQTMDLTIEGHDSICKIGPSLMPYVNQIQTINRHQRTHYTAQGQMVFDEISLNAIVKLCWICCGIIRDEDMPVSETSHGWK